MVEDKPPPGTGKTRYQRWHGLDKNAMKGGPPKYKKEQPYECMFDAEWLQENQPGGFQPMPTNFTLTENDIGDGELRAEDVKYCNGSDWN